MKTVIKCFLYLGRDYKIQNNVLIKGITRAGITAKIETFKWKVLQLMAVVSDARQNLVTKKTNPAEITDINQTFYYKVTYAAGNAAYKNIM